MASESSKDRAQIVPKSRSHVVKPGYLPVSEFAADRSGAAAPFGDDMAFPVSASSLTYRHGVADPATRPPVIE